MSLDDPVIWWKSPPSDLVSDSPREWSLVGLIPLLDPLWEHVGSKIGVEGFVVINFPRISHQCVVSHVLAD